MANKRIIELQERTSIDMGDWLIVDSSTSTRKLSLATLFNYMTYSSMIFVTQLPTTDISTTTIYLVPHSGSTTDWDEYVYRDNEWVLIGTSTIDLSAIYQTKTDNNLQTTSKQIVGAINELTTVAQKENGSVRVLMDGAKTYGQLFTELISNVDFSKLVEGRSFIQIYGRVMTVIQTDKSTYADFSVSFLSGIAGGRIHKNMPSDTYYRYASFAYSDPYITQRNYDTEVPTDGYIELWY